MFLWCSRRAEVAGRTVGGQGGRGSVSALVSSSGCIANKLHMQKVSDFALSPGDQPSKVKLPDAELKVPPRCARSHLPELLPGGRLRPGQQRGAVIRTAVPVPGAGGAHSGAGQQELLQGGPRVHAVEPEGCVPSGSLSVSPGSSVTDSVCSVGAAGDHEHRGGQDGSVVLRGADAALPGGEWRDGCGPTV